jgi:hypothetical protein
MAQWKPAAERRAEELQRQEEVRAQAARFPPIDPLLVQALIDFFPQAFRAARATDSERAIWMAAGALDVIETLREVLAQQQGAQD